MSRTIVGGMQMRNVNDAPRHMAVVWNNCQSLDFVGRRCSLRMRVILIIARTMKILQTRIIQNGMKLTSANTIQGRTYVSKYWYSGVGYPQFVTSEVVVMFVGTCTQSTYS